MRISPPRVWRHHEARYRLLGGECEECGARFHPPRPTCPRCGSRRVRRVELPRTGVVESFTVEYQVPEGFREQSPIVVAVVRLDDGTRVVAPLTDVEPSEVREGMRVEAVLRRVRCDGEYGLIAYGVKFRPLRFPRISS